MFPPEINYQLKITQVRFAPSLIIGKSEAHIVGLLELSVANNVCRFSAIIVGRMFIDSAGGPIKWNFEKFLINEQAHHRVDESLLRHIFKPNWERICYPCMPIVFSYNLNAKSPATAV